MPLRWEILHEQKLVHIVAEGAVDVQDARVADQRMQPLNLSHRPAD